MSVDVRPVDVCLSTFRRVDVQDYRCSALDIRLSMLELSMFKLSTFELSLFELSMFELSMFELSMFELSMLGL